MAYGTKILLDSISPAGRRLTTWELTYPRFVHAELMTHRLFSRNSASSRAIPIEKMLAQIESDPAMPVFWGKNQKGMQAAEELSEIAPTPDVARVLYNSRQVDGTLGTDYAQKSPVVGLSERDSAKHLWLSARNSAVQYARLLSDLGVHKQIVNRVTEPWMFITVIVSSTTFDNWFHLRDHWQAQPEIAWVARDMHAKWKESMPKRLEVGEWHLPFIEMADRTDAWQRCYDTRDESIASTFGSVDHRTVIMLKKVSAGRVARVSLLTHDGKRDLAEDVALHDKLLAGRATNDPLHMSPFEHVAVALDDPNRPSGNFRGWGQYRKEIPGEHHGEALP